MFLYGVWNKKTNCYDDFMIYDTGNELIDDCLSLIEMKDNAEKRNKSFALPNYLNFPDDYDLYRIAVVDSFDFTKPTTAVHQYRGCMSEVLKKNFLDKE